MSTDLHVQRIEEHPIPGKPLGRHVVHDPRSRAFAVEPRPGKVSAAWRRYSPILDQGNLGSCTGNAVTGVLGSSGFYGPLRAQRVAGLRLDESTAVRIYSAATKLDQWPGEYPPDDTGSSGLAAAKAAQQAGYVTGYRWAFGMDALHAAIQQGPLIVGTNWYEGMDDPDGHGVIRVAGQVRGGHEYELIGYSARTDRWKMVQSWGPGWGLSGYAYLTDVDVTRLLGEDGDATLMDHAARAN